MALITCHECGSNVSTEAQVCPGCGAKPKLPPPQGIGAIQFVGIGLLAVIGIIAFVSFFSDDDKADSAKADTACQHDLKCLGDKSIASASVYCQVPIEKLALHSVRWLDNGMFDLKFSRYRWKDREAGVLTFIGDRAEFQNGFGAYSPVTYECDFNPSTKTVLDVRAEPGRLP